MYLIFNDAIIDMYYFRSLIDFVMTAMEIHCNDKQIQYSCSAILSNLIHLNKMMVNGTMNLETQQKIIKIQLKIMNKHRNDPLVLKNSFILLSLFDFTKTDLVSIKVHRV